MSPLVENQNIIRSFFSLGGLGIFWGAALLLPFRKNNELKNKKRWFSNLALNFGNGTLIALVVPISLVQLSTSEYFTNLQYLKLPSQNFWIHFIFGIVLLDLIIYWQHRLTHKVNFLWKLHSIHHTDIEFDTTTAGRFHTLEIIFSYIVKAFFVILFGLNAESIIVFEIILNFSALFNHSNFMLPPKIDNVLKYFIVTPSIHRIHHSIYNNEMNSNFGFSVPFWDQIFSSFTTSSKENQRTMRIGLEKFRSPKDQQFFSLLLQPFLKK